MIHLDTYLEGFESKLEEIQSGIVYVKSYKKPKIRITRLSEERKFVPIELDIEINEKLVIKDRFDWNLNEENVSVDEFVNELCDSLRLPEINRTRLKSQLIYQLIDYIERNTFVPRPKPREPLKPEEIAEEPAGPEQIEGQIIETLNSQVKPPTNSTPSIADIVPINIPTINSQNGNREQATQPDEEQKKTARQRKLDELKRTTPSSMQTNSKIQFLRDRRSCKNCNHMNPAQSFECKKCKVAFYIMDMLDMSNWKVAQAVQYYQMVVSYFPLLADYVKDYLTGKEFESMYTLKNALITLFSTMKELNEENIQSVKERLEDIFGNFLAGVVIFQQPEVQPSKRRGRKPKAWYEEQDRLRKEKRSRGEAVSSESEEEDSGDDFEMPGVSTSVRPKKQKQSVNKEGNGDNEGDEDDGGDQNSDSSAIESRKYKGRPRKQNYTGKKRGRKSKSELLAMQQEKEKRDKDEKVSEPQGSKAEIEGEDGIAEEGAEKEELEDQSKVTDESGKIGEVVAKKRGRPPKIRPVVSSSEQQIAKPGSGLKRGRKPKSYYEERDRMELERQQNGGERGDEGKEEEKGETVKKPIKKVNSTGIPAKRGRPRKIRENEVVADDDQKEKNSQDIEEGGQGDMADEENNENPDDEKESRQKDGDNEEIVIKKPRGRKRKQEQEESMIDEEEQGDGQRDEEESSQGAKGANKKRKNSKDDNNSDEESNLENQDDEEIDQEKDENDDDDDDDAGEEEDDLESDKVDKVKGKQSKTKSNKKPEAMEEEEDSDEGEGEENESQKDEVEEDGEEENDKDGEDEDEEDDDDEEDDQDEEDEDEEESLGVRTRRSQVQKTKAISKQPIARTNINLRRTRKN